VTPARPDTSVGAEQAFATHVADLTVVQEKAHELADRCAARLRANGLVTRTITVKIRTSDPRTGTRSRTLTRSRALVTPTDVGRELFLAVRELVAGIDLRGEPVRLVGVQADGLSRAATSIRRPTLEEAPDGREPEAERATELLHRGYARGPIQAGVSQPRGVSSRSTTTFVPADLS
jgi:DNA polymerase-4